MKFFISCVFLSVLTWLIYSPGLSGGFIFDDFKNLSALEVLKGDITFDRLKYFLSLSESGPLLRPISIFSFLIDANNWPAEAYSFKRTNLIIHIINGLLLFTLLYLVFKNKFKNSQSVLLISLVSTAFWMLHPFFVSTTLYVIQRMAMLPVLFSLLGLLLFYNGRVIYAASGSVRGALLMFFGVYGMTLLAVLSKENGILLLFYIGLFEYFICQKYLNIKQLPFKLHLILITLPVFGLIGLLLIKIPGFVADYDIRPFSVGERLLTESRVMCKYLYHLFVPSYFTEGVFGNGISTSKGFFNPVSTFYSFVFLSLTLLTAWLLRNRFVFFSFSVFLFFVAHILESTIVPLDLYYEHRNYLAGLFLFVPLVLFLNEAQKRYKLLAVLPLLLLGILAVNTYVKSTIWGNNLKLHEKTMQEFPESVRARSMTAVMYDNLGYKMKALEAIEDAILSFDNLELKINRINILCSLNQVSISEVRELTKYIEKTPFEKQDFKPFGMLINRFGNGECLTDNSAELFAEITTAFLQNESVIGGFGKGMGYYLKADILFLSKKYKEAVKYYKLSFENSDGDFEGMITAVMKFINFKQLEIALSFNDYLIAEYDKAYWYKPDWADFGKTLNALNEAIQSQLNNE